MAVKREQNVEDLLTLHMLVMFMSPLCIVCGAGGAVLRRGFPMSAPVCLALSYCAALCVLLLLPENVSVHQLSHMPHLGVWQPSHRSLWLRDSLLQLLPACSLETSEFVVVSMKPACPG